MTTYDLSNKTFNNSEAIITELNNPDIDNIDVIKLLDTLVLQDITRILSKGGRLYDYDNRLLAPFYKIMYLNRYIGCKMAKEPVHFDGYWVENMLMLPEYSMMLDNNGYLIWDYVNIASNLQILVTQMFLSLKCESSTYNKEDVMMLLYIVSELLEIFMTDINHILGTDPKADLTIDELVIDTWVN